MRIYIHNMPHRQGSQAAQNSAIAPPIGTFIRMLRERNNVTVQELANGTGLSASFIHAVERDASDISLRRLSRLAQFFKYDLRSFLAYAGEISRPTSIGLDARKPISQGKGVRGEILHVPGIDLELAVLKIESRATFDAALSTNGVNIIYTMCGKIILVIDSVDYPMMEEDCYLLPAAYPHAMRNDSDRPAAALTITTGRVLGVSF